MTEQSCTNLKFRSFEEFEEMEALTQDLVALLPRLAPEAQTKMQRLTLLLNVAISDTYYIE